MMPPPNQQAPGTLLVSLDFELHWGIRDVKTVGQYRQNLLGVRHAVPALLSTFAEYDIHATWATVGLLFFGLRTDLLDSLPIQRPPYENPRLSPYQEIDGIGEDEQRDPFHFGLSLLEQIRSNPNQEIGTHTFSHYYCLEPKRSLAAFRADLTAAKAEAEKFGVALRSIVFPRNQYDYEHLLICREIGLIAFRGNAQAWFYRARASKEETPWLRMVRAADSYLDLSSHNCFALPCDGSDIGADVPLNLPASRFLRPYSARLHALQGLQERRIKIDLTYAAQNGLVYHLWWHPHNFGANLEKNLGLLRRILDHFRNLRERYGMRSRNMAECILTPSSVQSHVVIEEHRFTRPRR
jgi:peptidoglycan/xylan/chitin deacetylase (PgdA/CDA1 family)